MHMHKSYGFSYIVQARYSLSAWPEFRMLRTKTRHAEILCRWGGLKEIVTNNGTSFIVTLDWFAQMYHIRISAYNSQANGVVKHSHCTICDSLVKACNGDISQWPTFAHHIFWANHITTKKSTGHFPYYMAHGVDPLLPFDISEATFVIPEIFQCLETVDLIAICGCQLTKREEELTVMHKQVLKSCFTLSLTSNAVLPPPFMTSTSNQDPSSLSSTKRSSLRRMLSANRAISAP